jgi:hypothetical protein
MFNQFKTQTIFSTNAQFVSTMPKDEPPEIPAFIPIPKTKKEAKEANKFQYLPGERLSIQMTKQSIKDKKKDKKKKESERLDENDIDGITDSVGRITSLFDL